MASPLASIVTPVYNGEKYIVECIESVLAQTYQNWEYVIVDNCSTDGTPAIIERYAKQDKRIKLYRNETFLCQMANGSRSMEVISPESKYCKVVHADDWLFPECVSHMVSVAEENPNIGIVGAYRLEEERVTLDGLPHPSRTVTGREICRRYFIDNLYLFGSPSSLLIASSEVFKRKPFYNDNDLHSDIEACIDILKNKDFGFVHEVLTFTRRHNESASSFVKIYGTGYLSHFHLLHKYGRHFLSNKEYHTVLRRHTGKYYRFVARALTSKPAAKNNPGPKALLKYHQNALRDMGFQFRWPLLIKAFIINQFNRVLLRLVNQP